MASTASNETSTTGALTAAVVIEWAASTDAGRVRDLNEDTVVAEALEPGAPNPWQISGLLLVADGMGGHRAGEVASAMAGDLACQVFLTDQAAGLDQADIHGEAWHGHVSESVQYINRVVHRHSAAVLPAGAPLAGQGGGSIAPARLPGTTLTLCLVRPSEYCIAHVGDSRAYLIGAPATPRIRQLTDDDSMVAEAVRRGELTAEQARNSPFRNHITKAIGTEPEIEPAVSSGPWSEGEVLLLCSDGLTEYVTPDEILEFVHNTDTLQAACRALIAITNHRGGQDNISVVAARHGGAAPDLENVPDEVNSSEVSEPSLEPAHANGTVPDTAAVQAPLAMESEAGSVEEAAAPVATLVADEAAAGTAEVSPAAEVAAPIQYALAAVDAESPEAFPEFVLPHSAGAAPVEPAPPTENTSNDSEHPSTMSTSKPSPTKPPPSRASAPRPASRPPASKSPASKPSAPRSSGAGQPAMRPEGSGNSLQRQRAILVGSLVLVVTGVSMVLGVRSARRERANQLARNATQATAPVPTTMAAGATATPASGNGVSPAMVDGGAAATGPITIWLDSERRVVVVASKDHTVKAERGSNGNQVEPDADRPTRTLVSFKHWDAAAKQLASGDAELVCRTASQASQTDKPATPDHAYHSERDDQGHVKLNATAPLADTYLLEFRKTGAKDGQQLARFSMEAAAASTRSGTETTAGESGASTQNAAATENHTRNEATTDAASDNNVQR